MPFDDWGERQEGRPAISKAAITLVVIASQLLPFSLPWFVVSMAGGPKPSILLQLLAIPMGLFLITGPYVVMLLSYVMLYRLPAGSPVRGRLLVWIALGCGFLGALWSLMLLSVPAAIGTGPFAVVAAVLFLTHLAFFASESTGARYLAAGLLVLMTVCAIGAPALVRSRQQARTMQVLWNLKEVGLRLIDMESRGGGRNLSPRDVGE